LYAVTSNEKYVWLTPHAAVAVKMDNGAILAAVDESQITLQLHQRRKKYRLGRFIRGAIGDMRRYSTVGSKFVQSVCLEKQFGFW
jgi:hypothetical protein